MIGPRYVCVRLQCNGLKDCLYWEVPTECTNAEMYELETVIHSIRHPDQVSVFVGIEQPWNSQPPPGSRWAGLLGTDTPCAVKERVLAFASYCTTNQAQGCMGRTLDMRPIVGRWRGETAMIAYTGVPSYERGCILDRLKRLHKFTLVGDSIKSAEAIYNGFSKISRVDYAELLKELDILERIGALEQITSASVEPAPAAAVEPAPATAVEPAPTPVEPATLDDSAVLQIYEQCISLLSNARCAKGPASWHTSEMIGNLGRVIERTRDRIAAAEFGNVVTIVTNGGVQRYARVPDAALEPLRRCGAGLVIGRLAAVEGASSYGTYEQLKQYLAERICGLP